MDMPIVNTFRARTIARRFVLLAAALALVAGCASKKPKPPTVRHHQARNPVVEYALSFRGTPYVWGGETPREGFDCSGFVQYVYRHHGVYLPRTAKQMAGALPPVDRRVRKPGDLVFFNTTGKPYSHVGIYIGQNYFVHSSSSKGRVIISNLNRPYWWEHFLGIRRPGRMGRWLRAANTVD